MGKVFNWIKITFLYSIVLTLFSLLYKSENQGCFDICIFPEGHGFPFPLYNPEELKYYNSDPYYWGSLFIDIPFWFIFTAIFRPILNWFRKKIGISDIAVRKATKIALITFITAAALLIADRFIRPWYYVDFSSTHIFDGYKTPATKKFVYYSNLAKDKDDPKYCERVVAFEAWDMYISKDEAYNRCIRSFNSQRKQTIN